MSTESGLVKIEKLTNTALVGGELRLQLAHRLSFESTKTNILWFPHTSNRLTVCCLSPQKLIYFDFHTLLQLSSMATNCLEISPVTCRLESEAGGWPHYFNTILFQTAGTLLLSARKLNNNPTLIIFFATSIKFFWTTFYMQSTHHILTHGLFLCVLDVSTCNSVQVNAKLKSTSTH